MAEKYRYNKYAPTFPYTEDLNILMGYLREGNPDQRILAICRLPHDKKTYDLFWEIFLADQIHMVRCNALLAAIHSRQDKIWEILDYLITTNEIVNSWGRGTSYRINDDFIVQVAKDLHDMHKKEVNKK